MENERKIKPSVTMGAAEITDDDGKTLGSIRSTLNGGITRSKQYSVGPKLIRS